MKKIPYKFQFQILMSKHIVWFLWAISYLSFQFSWRACNYIFHIYEPRKVNSTCNRISSIHKCQRKFETLIHCSDFILALNVGMNFVELLIMLLSVLAQKAWMLSGKHCYHLRALFKDWEKKCFSINMVICYTHWKWFDWQVTLKVSTWRCWAKVLPKRRISLYLYVETMNN